MPAEFKQYKRKEIAQLRPYQTGDDMAGVSISDADKRNGSPKEGDMIARNPDDATDMWLVAKDYFEKHFAPVE